jgi:glycosyltransferase involved in cell wall biosynthesis
MCTYNAGRFVKTTLKSLLNQEYKNTEILVLDNNSSDNTLSILNNIANNHPEMRVFSSSKNLGPYGGLNFLLNKAQGEYIAIVDHDDIYHPKKIKKQINFLIKNEQYIGCGTSLYKYFEKDKTFKYNKIKAIGSFASHPSLIFRNNKRLKYNTTIKYKTDTHFMKYVLCDKKPLIANLREPLFLKRIRLNDANLSYFLNERLTYDDIFDYHRNTGDTMMLVKLLLKKHLNYNALKKITNLRGRKAISDFNHDDFFRSYLQYLK